MHHAFNKKILHVHHIDIRGEPRILRSIIEGSRAGYEVFGVGIEQVGSDVPENRADAAQKSDSRIETLSLNTRRLKFLPKPIRLGLSLLEASARIIASAIKIRPAVVHCHDVIALPAAVIIKLICRAKLIYDAHELESDTNALPRAQGILILNLEKAVWRLIDALIVVNDSIGEWYNVHVGNIKTVTILNTPTIPATPIMRSNYFRETYSLSTDTTVFLYLGALMPGRGIQLIVDSFKLIMRDAVLVFMGYGDYIQYLEAVSKEENSRVYVHPAVPHDQVVKIASSADFGFCLIENVSKSDYLSLPNKLLEYTFSNLPTIVSPFPELEKFVKQHRSGVTCELTVEAVVNIVNTINRDDFLIDTESLNDVTWQSQAVKLVALYQELIPAK
jgi:glycosyltransferase involved in cell wall biosynthesis